jgi:LPXTG-motif cell wall-anchored protein
MMTLLTEKTQIPQTESPSTTTQDSGTTSTSTSEPTNDPPPNSDGLPAGTAAGIGVGVGLGVLAGLAFFFWRRRRRQAGAATATTPGSPHPPSYGPVEAASKPTYSPYSQLQTPSPRPATAEMPGDLGVTHELDSGYQR